jgi:Protein of unknown function (DUF3606)
MISRKPAYFRNALDLRNKVQVKVLRRRLKLTDEQFASIVRKSGRSISAITKEAGRN